MATYWEFFVTNTTGPGGFTSAHADAAGGPRWGANGAPILTATGGTAQFVGGAPPGRTFLERTTGNWGTTTVGDRICMIIPGGAGRYFAEVTALVSAIRIEIMGTYPLTPQPTEVRVGGVALSNSAANLRTFMERMLAGTYLTTNAWRLNIHRSGTDWASPNIDGTLSGIGPGQRALTMQGFLAAAGDLTNTESRPKFYKAGVSASERVMLSLDADNTRIRFYDIDFEFQPVTTGFATGDVVSAIVVSKPGYTFCRSKISVTATPNVPVQVLRLENAKQTVRTCWIVRPAGLFVIAPDGIRTPSTCIYVTHNDPSPLGPAAATILGNLLDGPTLGIGQVDPSLYNCGIHLQAGSRHRIENNIFRKQHTGLLAETIFHLGTPTFPTCRFERNTLVGPMSYGLMLKWWRDLTAPFQELSVANNIFYKLNVGRAVAIISDSGTSPYQGTLGYVGFNTFADCFSTIETQYLFDTSEQHNFLAPGAALFVSEANEDYRLAWTNDKLGINSLLQIGARLNGDPNPPPSYENRSDPGACGTLTT